MIWVVTSLQCSTIIRLETTKLIIIKTIRLKQKTVAINQ